MAKYPSDFPRSQKSTSCAAIWLPQWSLSRQNLIKYYVEDGATVDRKAKKGYSERFIHCGLFKRSPEVNCVVYSYAEAILSYVTSGVPLLPAFHMAGFLGELLSRYSQEGNHGLTSYTPTWKTYGKLTFIHNRGLCPGV